MSRLWFFLRIRRTSADERREKGKEAEEIRECHGDISRRRSSSRRKLLNSVELSPKKLARTKDNASRRETEKVRAAYRLITASAIAALVNCLRAQRLPRRSLIVGWNSSLNRNSDRNV